MITKSAVQINVKWLSNFVIEYRAWIKTKKNMIKLKDDRKAVLLKAKKNVWDEKMKKLFIRLEWDSNELWGTVAIEKY